MPLIVSGEGHLEVPGAGERALSRCTISFGDKPSRGYRVVRDTVGVEEPSPGYAL